jgi:hypothetical protein
VKCQVEKLRFLTITSILKFLFTATLVYIYCMHWIKGIRRNCTRFNCLNFVLLYNLFILVFFLHVTEITSKFLILPVVKFGEFFISNAQHAFGFTSSLLQLSWIAPVYSPGPRIILRVVQNRCFRPSLLFSSLRTFHLELKTKFAFLNYVRSSVKCKVADSDLFWEHRKVDQWISKPLEFINIQFKTEITTYIYLRFIG